jgi:hypothetical protein
MMRTIRHGTTLLILTVLLVVGFGVGALVATGSDRNGASPPPIFGTRSARAASVTATKVFSSLQLPHGAVPIVPAKIGKDRLAHLGYYAAAQSSGAVRVGIWQVPLAIGNAATYFEHHVPSGLHYEEHGVDLVPNAYGTFGGAVTFSSRSMNGPADATTPYTIVSYSLTAATGTTKPTDVVVGVDVVWEPYRTALEKVPVGTTTVQITRIGFHPEKTNEVVSTRSVASTSRAVIGHFASVIDHLQPFLLGEGFVLVASNHRLDDAVSLPVGVQRRQRHAHDRLRRVQLRGRHYQRPFATAARRCSCKGRTGLDTTARQRN